MVEKYMQCVLLILDASRGDSVDSSTTKSRPQCGINDYWTLQKTIKKILDLIEDLLIYFSWNC